MLETTDSMNGNATSYGMLGKATPLPSTIPQKAEYTVDFEGPDDPIHPHNWPQRKKVYAGGVANYTCLCSTFASAVLSPAQRAIGHTFDVSEEVATLATSLFVMGYALGPLVWAPLSELRGRKLPLVVSMFGFAAFSAGAATGKDLQIVLICRFFAGVMGSSPLTVAAGVHADMYDHAHRATALAIFAGCIFVG